MWRAEQFELEDGFWMASTWVQQNCAPADTACVLARVYPCENSQACSNDAPRQNEGSANHVAEDVLCREGHAGDVVLCKGCDQGYQMKVLTGLCDQCPKNTATVWVQFISVSMLFVVVIGLMVSILLRLSPNTFSLMLMRSTLSLTAALLSLLLGHLQILSQTSLIFHQDAIPAVYDDTVTFLGAIFNIADWTSAA
eukprot:gene13253-15661_t